MARYGHIKPDAMHAELKSHFESQPKLMKGQDAHDIASVSAADYKSGHDKVEQVKLLLLELGKQAHDAEQRKSIDLAINTLHEATTAFGNACLVQNNHWDKDDA